MVHLEDANVDTIFQGQAFGTVAEKLLANNMDIKKLRSNTVLTYDEWKEIDRVVLQEAQIRLGGVEDLISRGLVFRTKGLGATVLQYQDESDIEDASVNMDGINKGQRDRPEYDTTLLPLPIVSYDFSYTAREIAASRNVTSGSPLDTRTATKATRKVMEKVEEILFLGNNAYTAGGGTIRGYTDHPNRNTGSLTANWDASAASGTTIKNDMINMKQASINDRHYGPWVCYVPTAYETVLDDDYRGGAGSSDNQTIRDRLLKISGIQDIKIIDKLTANNVLLVQPTSDVVRMVEGLAINTIQWESEGGMKINFKVLIIMIPQIRKTQALRSGIQHYT